MELVRVALLVELEAVRVALLAELGACEGGAVGRGAIERRTYEDGAVGAAPATVPPLRAALTW